MSWSARSLISQVLSDGSTVAYTYDSDGIRTSKTYTDSLNNSVVHSYILDGTTILGETVTDSSNNTSKTLYYLYDSSGMVAGVIYNYTPYYFQKNVQGDVLRILNPIGNVVTEYTYDAWGNILSVTGSGAADIGALNPFRYRGYYYDTETGYYYLNSSYYDPTVGRFLNGDAFLGINGGILGYNLFAYCNNNPVIYSDPSGNAAQFSAPPQCDEEILELIEDADVYTTTDNYNYCFVYGKYKAYVFTSDIEVKIKTRYFFGFKTTKTYKWTEAVYYFEVTEEIVEQRRSRLVNKLVSPTLGVLTWWIEAFACYDGSLDAIISNSRAAALAQLAADHIVVPIMKKVREEIVTYAKIRKYRLRYIIETTYENGVKTKQKKIYP